MIGSAAEPLHVLPSSAPQIFHPSESSRDSGQNLRKRKRSDSSEDGEQIRRSKFVSGNVPDKEDLVWSKEKRTEVRMSGILPPGFIYPKTAYNGHVPSMLRYSEERVLADILVGGTKRTLRTLSKS